MQHSGTKRKQVEQAMADADSSSYASSAACSAMTPCKADRDQSCTDECCKRSATEACSPLLDVAQQQDQLNQGLKYLEDILRVDTYQKPMYHRGTSIPVDGWIQPCNGCRSWTASSITISPENELPLCKRCLIQIINLQRAQAQQRLDMAATLPGGPAGPSGQSGQFVPAKAVDEHNTHACGTSKLAVPHPDYTPMPTSGGKLRRWSEADMECRANSSQDSHSSVACAQSSGCTSSDPGSRLLPCSSPSYNSATQFHSKSDHGCMLKRRAICLTP